ncbi:unnamed protein product [Amoebophrya sp. A120]|nr:unnamed protein product [Amoebophrya sp. A120]|eukprot:GSA120T00024810001.1
MYDVLDEVMLMHDMKRRNLTNANPEILEAVFGPEADVVDEEHLHQVQADVVDEGGHLHQDRPQHPRRTAGAASSGNDKSESEAHELKNVADERSEVGQDHDTSKTATTKNASDREDMALLTSSTSTRQSATENEKEEPTSEAGENDVKRTSEEKNDSQNKGGTSGDGGGGPSGDGGGGSSPWSWSLPSWGTVAQAGASAVKGVQGAAQNVFDGAKRGAEALRRGAEAVRQRAERGWDSVRAVFHWGGRADLGHDIMLGRLASPEEANFLDEISRYQLVHPGFQIPDDHLFALFHNLAPRRLPVEERQKLGKAAGLRGRYSLDFGDGRGVCSDPRRRGVYSSVCENMPLLRTSVLAETQPQRGLEDHVGSEDAAVLAVPPSSDGEDGWGADEHRDVYRVPLSPSERDYINTELKETPEWRDILPEDGIRFGDNPLNRDHDVHPKIGKANEDYISHDPTTGATQPVRPIPRAHWPEGFADMSGTYFAGNPGTIRPSVPQIEASLEASDRAGSALHKQESVLHKDVNFIEWHGAPEVFSQLTTFHATARLNEEHAAAELRYARFRQLVTGLLAGHTTLSENDQSFLLEFIKPSDQTPPTEVGKNDEGAEEERTLYQVLEDREAQTAATGFHQLHQHESANRASEGDDGGAGPTMVTTRESSAGKLDDLVEDDREQTEDTNPRPRAGRSAPVTTASRSSRAAGPEDGWKDLRRTLGGGEAANWSLRKKVLEDAASHWDVSFVKLSASNLSEASAPELFDFVAHPAQEDREQNSGGNNTRQKTLPALAALPSNYGGQEAGRAVGDLVQDGHSQLLFEASLLQWLDISTNIMERFLVKNDPRTIIPAPLPALGWENFTRGGHRRGRPGLDAPGSGRHSGVVSALNITDELEIKPARHGFYFDGWPVMAEEHFQFVEWLGRSGTQIQDSHWPSLQNYTKASQQILKEVLARLVNRARSLAAVGLVQQEDAGDPGQREEPSARSPSTFTPQKIPAKAPLLFAQEIQMWHRMRKLLRTKRENARWQQKQQRNFSRDYADWNDHRTGLEFADWFTSDE